VNLERFTASSVTHTNQLNNTFVFFFSLLWIKIHLNDVETLFLVLDQWPSQIHQTDSMTDAWLLRSAKNASAILSATARVH